MKRLFAFLFTVVAFAACEDVSIETPPEIPTTPSKITIVTPQPTIISDEGGEAVVEFVAPEPWVIKIDDTNSADWMEVEPMGGNAGSTKITITAEPNSAYDKRTAIVSIKAGTVEAAIAVTQSQKNSLIASVDEVNIDNLGGTIDFDVTTNVDLTVTISDDAKEWISDVSTRAMETKTLSFEIASNMGEAERSGEIAIAGGGLEQTVVVLQRGCLVSNNEIWYTSTDGNVVTPTQTDVFGANIVSNVYKNGKGIITFDGTVTSIGKNAFMCCTSLTSITLPEGVTSIGDYAFWICSSLESITLPNSVTAIGEQAFYRCSSLTSITLPEGVTSIGHDAFVDCTSLSSITIPDSVTSIVGNPFMACSSLTTFNGKYASADNRCLIVDGELKSFAPAGLISYTIPSGVTSIGSAAFSVCSSLESITIPDGVTVIRIYAFEYCSSLESITIPSSVTSIEYDAFDYCDSLTTVYSKPTTPPSLGGATFYYCDSQLKIYVPTSSVNAYKSASGWSEYASQIEGYDFSN